MADPRTWSLLGDFAACLAQITVANGYHTDAGTKVIREPSQVPDDDSALIAIALEGLAPAAQAALARTHQLATVVLIGKAAVAGEADQYRMHLLLEDIQRAMAGQQAAFGAGRGFPAFVSATPIPPAEGVRWTGVQVRYSTHVLR